MDSVKLCQSCVEKKVAINVHMKGKMNLLVSPADSTFAQIMEEIREELGDHPVVFRIMETTAEKTVTADKRQVAEFEKQTFEELAQLETGQFATVSEQVRKTLPVFIHCQGESGIIFAGPNTSLMGSFEMAQAKFPARNFAYEVVDRVVSDPAASSSDGR